MTCSNCNNIEIDASLSKCPLCGKSIGEKGDSRVGYPTYKLSYVKEKRVTLTKMCLFLSICATIISITINVLTYARISFFWSIIVSVGMFYIWVTIENTIKSKTHIGGKVLFQFFCISIVLSSIDVISGFYKWSTTFAIPFLSIGTTLILTILSFINKSKWYEYTGFMAAALFACIVPFALGFTPLTIVNWACITAFIYSFITVIGMLIFSDKKFKAEIKKRFHT